MRPPNLCTVLRVLLVLLLCAERCVAVKWLALYRIKQRPWETTRNCTRSSGLAARQMKLCRDNLDLMSTVVHSAMVSMETCQQQFADRRWNCSSILRVPSLPMDLVRGTREQAYVYGISSSALVHSISRACSIGVTTKCSCGVLPNTTPTGNFKWGGCGDDLHFGLLFGEAFTDATLRNKKGKVKTSKKAMMNRHNFRVGRKVVADSLTQACKCHGVSGSCSIKTCWRALPSFDSIGALLKDRYALAVEVRRKRRKKMKVLIPIHKGRASFRDDELVYYEKSPDYCSPDSKTGSVGTRGRLCESSGWGPGNCDSMCCGRGYNNFTMEVTERCECKYIWCCYVKCKVCTKLLKLSQCR
ncbi:protein Wnt-11b-2 [Aplysia californica]|uniref:Protein Wnt n=1 Tax=Aplysia californica TaxID=6500 RepID=A0ABM0ZVK7_APLCA|nr:protein Wnt-11b-2 [Aplysia californica]XP_012935445.1 protein Wnt-11b-2 [Aplysia californica]